MTKNLPDAPVPRRKQILPEGVIRAKDNVDDFSFSSKPLQEEAEHNMGYFLVELNNRNQELENLVERQDRDLKALRRENADLRERGMKVVHAVDPLTIPSLSDAAVMHKQRQQLADKSRALCGAELRVAELKTQLEMTIRERDQNDQRSQKYAQLCEHWKSQAEHHETQYNIVDTHRVAWKIAAILFFVGFAGALIIGA